MGCVAEEEEKRPSKLRRIEDWRFSGGREVVVPAKVVEGAEGARRQGWRVESRERERLVGGQAMESFFVLVVDDDEREEEEGEYCGIQMHVCMRGVSAQWFLSQRVT